MTSAPWAAPIGIVGNDVPRQVPLAARAIPQRLTGSWEAEPARPDADLLGAVDVVAARLLSELGSRTDLAGVVVSNDSQAHLRLFYILRAAQTRLPVHLLDLPRIDSAPARRFARGGLERLAAFCADLTGGVVDVASLAAAAEDERLVGDALQRMRARRRTGSPTCSGVQALDAYRAAMSLPPAEALERIDAARNAPVEGRLRVHVTGSGHPDATLYRMIEDAGCLVVSDDHDTGDLSWVGVAAGGDTVAAVWDGLVAAHFSRVGGSATAYSADRAELTRTIVAASKADVVAAFVRDEDDAPRWDLPDQTLALGELGVPLLAARIAPGDERTAAGALAARLHRTAAA